jgi:16S rRNA (adenine1518-N6/adenine1519-N6)-dimethyltransferase
MGSYSPLVKPNAIAPKKRLGQHFLRDTGIIDRIVRWMDPGPEDIFIEIGAGDGALSIRLAPRVAKILAIEVDRDCIPILETALSPFDSAEVMQGDILEIKPQLLASALLKTGRKLRVAGNLPYNISTAIIATFLKSGLPIEDMLFMVQTEVAQRITAPPGSRQYGYLSVLCQHHCDVQPGFKISPSCFVPRPAFGHRRKTLANSLGRHPVFSGLRDSLLRRAGIDGSRRAEMLSVPEFEILTRVYREADQSASGNEI